MVGGLVVVGVGVALVAWAMFGETFGLFELGGLVVAGVGVALVTLTPKPGGKTGTGGAKS